MHKVKRSHVAAAVVAGAGGSKGIVQEALQENVNARAELIAEYVEQYVMMAHAGKDASLPIDSFNPNKKEEAQLAEALGNEILGRKSKRVQGNALDTMMSALSPASGAKKSVEAGLQENTNQRATRLLSRMRANDFENNGLLDANGKYEASLAEALQGALAKKNITLETKWADVARSQGAGKSAAMSY